MYCSAQDGVSIMNPIKNQLGIEILQTIEGLSKDHGLTQKDVNNLQLQWDVLKLYDKLLYFLNELTA